MSRNIVLSILTILVLLALGCSGNGASPVTAPVQERVTESAGGSHQLWGLWQISANPEKQTLDIAMLRAADMHLNALQFLEPPPFVNLTLESLKFNGDLVEADIGLRHPFLGLDEFTGFDVCGILITDGSVTGYADSDIRMAGDGDTRLLNPDGFARWWNPSEFPINNGTMFSYKDGLLGTPDSVADYNSTVNAYKYFCEDLDADDGLENLVIANRGVFRAGMKNVRHYTIELGAGLIFNYAVDANWQFPTGGKPWVVPDDFVPEANRPEAYRIEVTELVNTLWNDGSNMGGDLSLSIDVYDWYNAELNTVRAECLEGLPEIVSDTPVASTDDFATYELEFTDVAPGDGSVDILITIESEIEGYGGLLPGKTVSAYFMYTADVANEPPPEGELVALADANAYEIAPGTTVSFNGTHSYDENGYSIVQYTWDFGDSSPVAYGEFVNHPYTTAGLYDVTLTVENEIGMEDDDVIGIIVCDCSTKSERHLPSGPYTALYDLDSSNEDDRKRSTDHMYANDYWVTQSADKIVAFDMSMSGNLNPVLTLATGVTGIVYSLDCGLDDRVAWAEDTDKTVIHIVDSDGDAITDVNAPDGEEFWAADFDVDDDLWVVSEDGDGNRWAHQYIKGDDDSYDLVDTWTHQLPEIKDGWHVFEIQVLHSTESMYLVTDIILPGDTQHPTWPKPRIDAYDRFGDHIRSVAPYNWSVYQDPFPYADIELDSTDPELEACRLNFFDVYTQPGGGNPYFCSHYRRWTLLLTAIGPQFDNGMHRYQSMDVSNVTKQLRAIEIGSDTYFRYLDIPSDW